MRTLFADGSRAAARGREVEHGRVEVGARREVVAGALPRVVGLDGEDDGGEELLEAGGHGLGRRGAERAPRADVVEEVVPEAEVVSVAAVGGGLRGLPCEPLDDEVVGRPAGGPDGTVGRPRFFRER